MDPGLIEPGEICCLCVVVGFHRKGKYHVGNRIKKPCQANSSYSKICTILKNLKQQVILAKRKAL